jgi:hypothetical protein
MEQNYNLIGCSHQTFFKVGVFSTIFCFLNRLHLESSENSDKILRYQKRLKSSYFPNYA